MYFFVLVVLKGEFRLRLISPIDSLVLVWRGRPGFQVTKFQQVVNSGGSRRGTGGLPPPPRLFLDQTEARRAEKFFWRPGPSSLSKRERSTSFSLALSQDWMTGPLSLIQERMIYLILSCLISGLNDRAPLPYPREKDLPHSLFPYLRIWMTGPPLISRSGSGTGQFSRSGTPGRPRLFESWKALSTG